MRKTPGITAFGMEHSSIFDDVTERIRDRRGYSGTVKASWINIVFTHAALAKLSDDADAFADHSFRTGIVPQSPALGDPSSPRAEGHPNQMGQLGLSAKTA